MYYAWLHVFCRVSVHKTFFELTPICVYVTKIHYYLSLFSSNRVYSCVSNNIFCIRGLVLPFCDFPVNTVYCLALETKKIVSQKPRVGLMVAVLSFFPFFLPLVKIMKVINFFYLCLSSLKNFIFICDILSEYQ